MNKPFLKSKGWLTLSEAAKQLALAWKCDVTEADILQLSLSRHLTLSVYFVNNVTVATGKYFAVLKGGGDFLRSFDERFLTSSAEVSIISGCKWGLPLLLDDDRFSGNWFAIEREYHRLTRGPDVTCKGSSIKLVDSDGKSWQLQQGVSYAEYYADLLSYREKLKRFVDEKRITKEQGVEFMAQHQEKSYEFLTKLILAPPLEYSYYYPAKNLPNDAILVIQTKDLIGFEPLIDDLSCISRIEQQPDSQPRIESNKKNSPKKRGKTKITVFLEGLCQQQDINALNAEALVRSIKPLVGQVNCPVEKHHGFYDGVCVEWKPGTGSPQRSWGKKTFQNFVTDYKKDNK